MLLGSRVDNPLVLQVDAVELGGSSQLLRVTQVVLVSYYFVLALIVHRHLLVSLNWWWDYVEGVYRKKLQIQNCLPLGYRYIETALP